MTDFNRQQSIVFEEPRDFLGLNREETLEAFSDDATFESFVSKYGRLIRCLTRGESFGELALKDSTARSATAFCRTDCEFLILTKKQFDKMLLSKERDKEVFFREIFPHLARGFVSEVNFNHFLSSFKVKLYKISYL